ncbi:MAG TPA: TonB-dependent receptor plug domain-containing protein [Chitinophagales bacterium]|nr:TonB-dependent receptor plug domain-containing protein [Chitinophagales bacterium]
MRLAFTYLLWLPFTTGLAGNINDTIALDEVVKVEHVGYNNGESPLTDLKYKQGERLGDALGQFSSVYIKSYGSGGLASLAIRGTTAEQTEIEWNGIRLNSPSLGQVDLSLFLLGMQDELKLVRTGYQGNIGGVLKMDNGVNPGSGFSISGLFRYGSFSTYNAMLSAMYAKGKFSGATKFTWLSSKNDFLYQNNFREGRPWVKQTNASVNQLSFLQQFNAKVNERNQLGFYLWLTDASRQIPPLMSQQGSLQNEDDYSLRAMANWTGTYNQLWLKFTSAWLNDKMHYKDPNALLDDIYTTYALRNKLNMIYLFPHSVVLTGQLNYDHEQANISAYGSNKMREQAGLRVYADYYIRNQIRLHAGFREDLNDKTPSPFAPELALNYTAKPFKNNHFAAGIMASRNFRFPTLNDLYWNPGGNLNLRQEKSWNGEMNFKYAYATLFDVSLTGFSIYATDWIQWVPDGSIWQAENFRRVFSRGAEASLHVTNTGNISPLKFKIDFNASYTYTKTTNLDAVSVTDQSAGKQLIYVPYHNVVTGIQFSYRRFYLRVVNTYTGPVYISTDNSQQLKGYFISNLEIGKEVALKNVELGFAFSINNIGNNQYQVVAQRPMPGRGFEGSVRFKFYNQ